MKKLIKYTLREPLFHFFVLGGVLYLYFSISDPSTISSKDVISIDKNQINLKYDQEDNSSVIDDLIEVKFYEKILLQEAYKRDLHLQDKHIADILINKMQFIVDNKSVEVDPSEEELHEYYKKNLDDYAHKKLFSFQHVFFQTLSDKSESVSKLLNYGVINDIDISKLGEHFSSKNYKSISKKELDDSFGKYFALHISRQKKGVWSKAIRSNHGYHFIYVHSYSIGERYEFDEVIDRVHQDYLLEKTLQKRKDFFKKMKSKYSLEVLDD